MAYEGSSAKLEVVRGLSTPFRFWPREEGRKLAVTSTPTVRILEPTTGEVAAPTAAVDADGAIAFAWTPAATATLAEDYLYEVSYVGDGVARKERVYFDLVLRSLECPVDESALSATEPRLEAMLQAAGIGSAEVFIAAAWDEVIQRIRAQGFRPALLADAGAFAPFVRARALELLFQAAIRAPDDTADRKRGLYHDAAEAAWSLVGPLKFETVLGDVGAVGQRSSLPRFSI